jgi:hypothetical protein
VGRLAVLPAQLVNLWPCQPTAGRFDVVGDEVRFVPRLPPLPGTTYSLLVDGVEVASAMQPVRAATAETRVVAIYPSARVLPLNQLKLYIHFSAPMSEGWASRAVHVRRSDDGRSLPGVFLPMEPELWDRARQRLTLLLDPGRIKRGLAPNEELGYPLEDGVPIVVAVDPDFRDAAGRPLRSGSERRYEVGSAIRQHVTTSTWTLHCPAAHSLDWLRVEFDRPLDRALVEHSLVVLDAGGRQVGGRASIAEGESGWCFTPLQPWRPAPYHLNVDARLEDLAGNSLTRVFDRDLTRPEDSPIAMESATIPFQPR